MKNELVRKSAHAILALFFAFVSPFVLKGTLVLFSCVLFIFFLFIRFFKFFDSVVNIPRVSYGEFFFVLGVVSAVFLSWPNIILFQTSMIVLALADPLASLFGKSFGKQTYFIFGEKRTFEGSSVFFLVTFLICIFTSFSFIFSLCTAVFLTLVEAVSIRGSDNFFLPVGFIYIVILFENILVLNVLNTIHI